LQKSPTLHSGLFCKRALCYILGSFTKEPYNDTGFFCGAACDLIETTRYVWGSFAKEPYATYVLCIRLFCKRALCYICATHKTLLQKSLTRIFAKEPYDTDKTLLHKNSTLCVGLFCKRSQQEYMVLCRTGAAANAQIYQVIRARHL